MEPQEKKYPYPEGYEQIAEKVAVDVERIRIIDTEIERLRTAPEEGGPKPTLKPDGEPEIRQPTNAEKSAYLKSQKEQIQQDSFDFVDKEAAREKNPTTQRVLRDAVRNELYGNPYEGMSDEQMRTTRQQQGSVDLEQSADFMEAQRGRTPNKPAPTREQAHNVTSEKAVFVTPSHYAMQSLNYTRMSEKADTLPGKSSVETKLQDKQGSDKPLLPSEMASLSLNYTVITQDADRVADQAPDKSPEPDPDKDGPDFTP